jgi:hypothetical protein
MYQPDSSFSKMGGSGSSWKYKDEGEGAAFFGIYRSKEEDVGENHSTVYTFMRYTSDKFDKEAGLCDVWGSSLLDLRFSNLQPGEQVVIIYLGSESSAKRKGKSYHNFDVFHKMPITKTEEEEAKKELEENFDFDLDTEVKK